MGTNYYANIDTCKHCGRSDKVIHIGKSSIGWRFAIDVSNDNHKYYVDWKSFIAFIRRSNVQIVDEYDGRRTADDLIGLIEEKKSKRAHLNNLWVEVCPADILGYSFS